MRKEVLELEKFFDRPEWKEPIEAVKNDIRARSTLLASEIPEIVSQGKPLGRTVFLDEAKALFDEEIAPSLQTPAGRFVVELLDRQQSYFETLERLLLMFEKRVEELQAKSSVADMTVRTDEDGDNVKQEAAKPAWNGVKAPRYKVNCVEPGCGWFTESDDKAQLGGRYGRHMALIHPRNKIGRPKKRKKGKRQDETEG